MFTGGAMMGCDQGMKYLKNHIHAIWASLIILLGTALRIVLLGAGWPSPNSDDATMGLVALHIAYHGEHPIFLYGQAYMGTSEAYVAAALFRIFGPSLFTLRIGLAAFFALFLVGMYFLTSQLYSKSLALIVLGILSLGNIVMFYWQLRTTGGYPELLPCAALLFLLAFWLARSYSPDLPAKKRWLRLAGFLGWGYLAGFGLWSDTLIAPFILTTGLLILIFCWHEWKTWAPIFLILGFVLGILPTILYNINVPFEQGSLYAFLHTYNTDTTGQALQQVPLSNRLLGTFQVALPEATGDYLFCTNLHMPDFQILTPGYRHCTLLQGGWSLGYFVLYVIAVYLAISSLWKLRTSAMASKDQPQEHRLAIINQATRLALLATAALVILLYTYSPVAALEPGLSARYLIGLSIVTPAVLAPLWNGAIVFKSFKLLPAPWLEKLWAGARAIILLYIIAILLVGTVNTLQAIAPTQAVNQHRQALVSELEHTGATRIYTDYWTCDLVAFLSNERIICSVIDEQLNPGINRYPPYTRIVQADPRASYVLPVGSPEASAFARKAGQSGKHYRHFVFDGYDIYQPVS